MYLFGNNIPSMLIFKNYVTLCAVSTGAIVPPHFLSANLRLIILKIW